ncbi:MAG: DoxX family protein [Maribacter sp.]|jgi:putative oxidoreductase|nr:DoxX family protein [Maribacter sp.]NNK18944.1 DoxX family protein [Maribacter sp.]
MTNLKSYYKWLNEPIIQKTILADFVLFIPRFVCGFLLAKDFGADKFGMPWSPEHLNLGMFEVAYWFPLDVAEYGGIFAIYPAFFAWMGAFSEAVGGIFLALGLKTRIAAFLIVCTMLVAIFGQKWGQGVWGMLPAMGFLWVGLYCLVLGSGRMGIDYLINSKLK